MSSSSTNINITDMIGTVVRQAVEKKTREIAEKAKAELEAEIPKIVAGVSLEFQKYITLETFREQIVITIKKQP